MYQIRPPAPPLARFIDNYWFVGGPGPVDTSVNVFVDGRADLIFNFAGPYVREVIGGEERNISRSNLDAQRLVPIRIAQRGIVRTIGVRFRLGGLAPFARVRLKPFTGMTPAPHEVIGDDARDLEAALAETEDVDLAARLLDAHFTSHLELAPAFDSFDRALQCAVSSDGAATVEAMAEAVGVSTRQLERLFARYLGIAPKPLGRILRFQVALRALMRDPGCTLADVAARAGYFDQAHFIKEFKRMSGGVPRGYRGYYPEHGPHDFAPNVVVFVQDRPRRIG